jgi:hypothetical protein
VSRGIKYFVSGSFALIKILVKGLFDFLACSISALAFSTSRSPEECSSNGPFFFVSRLLLSFATG